MNHRVDQKNLEHGYFRAPNAALGLGDRLHEGGDTGADSGVTRKYPIKGNLLAIRKSLSEPPRNMEAIGFAPTFIDVIFNGFRGPDESHFPGVQAQLSVVADKRQATLFYELEGIIRLK